MLCENLWPGVERVSEGLPGMGGAASKMCGSQNVSGPETADPKEQIADLLRLGLNRREVCVGHMPLERVVVGFAAHSRLASSV